MVVAVVAALARAMEEEEVPLTSEQLKTLFLQGLLWQVVGGGSQEVVALAPEVMLV